MASSVEQPTGFTSINALNREIIRCRLCPRLVRHRERAAVERPRRYADEEYWAKPLPGFGSPTARLLILGLAPAAHGGNRTGRMFTGDGSAMTLMRALYETGFANKHESVRLGDGLELRDTYVTAIVRCPPPGNLPSRQEISNCLSYLVAELNLLTHLEAVVTLGGLAFHTYLKVLKLYSTAPIRTAPKFRHGGVWKFHGDMFGRHIPILFASYHPSRQNTQTGRLTPQMLKRVFLKVRRLLDAT